MIFVGDIAFPAGFNGFGTPKIFRNKILIANLEGPIVDKGSGEKLLSKHVVFNDYSVLKYLQANNVKLVSLANNHILDVPNSFDFTRQSLKESGINFVGAGNNILEASKEVKMVIDGQLHIFLAFGWSVVNCVSARKDKPGVNPLTPDHVLESVIRNRKLYPEAKIVLLNASGMN